MAHSRVTYIVFLITLFFCGAEFKVNYRYYPRYHLAPPKGWMNDPNGFCFFRGVYHLFYQYNPKSSKNAGIAHWGHARSKDLIYWEHLPIAMYPDQWYDETGVFSGSALVEDDKMYLVYTGNVNHPDRTPDKEEHQALAVSTDGIRFKKYSKNPIIYGKEFQPNFRDPKIWKHGDTYYMVLGNSFQNNTLGRVLLYKSANLTSWEEVSVIANSTGFLGRMWECPDFFEIDGYFVLLFSPQGMKPDRDNYRNLYQTGYIIGKFNYDNFEFVPLTKFIELDRGHDFYATQTTLDNLGRRIVVAWFDMWENIYPERDDGWSGQITIPRVLSVSGHCPDCRLIQKVVKEFNRPKKQLLYNGKASYKTVVTLENQTGDIILRAPASNDLDFYVKSVNSSATVKISYDSKNCLVTLDRGGNDGIRRAKWCPKSKLKWRIFLDASSLELFCGDGELTFSSRFFLDGELQVFLGQNSLVDLLQVNSIL